MKRVYISLGANIPGAWGTPPDALSRALLHLRHVDDIEFVASSGMYRTSAVGSRAQPDYLNAAAQLHTSVPASRLLSLFKHWEREAGRRVRGRWTPRPLDIDVIDFGGQVLNWPGPARREPGRLILPHPEAHKRAFVLVPLAEIAPGWQHPVLHRTARQLLLAGPRSTGGVMDVAALDSPC